MDPEQILPQEKTINLRSFNGKEGVYHIPAKAPNALHRRYDWLEMECKENQPSGFEDDYRIVAKYGYSLKPAEKKEYTARIRCDEAYEYIEFERLGGSTEVYLNGVKIGDTFRIHGRQANNSIRPYRFYGHFASGENEVKVISLRTESDPPEMSGYVKIGKRVATPWRVKLHYGKARVFVQTTSPEETRLRLKATGICTVS